jgi:hypothetical protein
MRERGSSKGKFGEKTPRKVDAVLYGSRWARLLDKSDDGNRHI